MKQVAPKKKKKGQTMIQNCIPQSFFHEFVLFYFAFLNFQGERFLKNIYDLLPERSINAAKRCGTQKETRKAEDASRHHQFHDYVAPR